MQRIPMQAIPAIAHMFIMSPVTAGGLMTPFRHWEKIRQRIFVANKKEVCIERDS